MVREQPHRRREVDELRLCVEAETRFGGLSIGTAHELEVSVDLRRRGGCGRRWLSVVRLIGKGDVALESRAALKDWRARGDDGFAHVRLSAPMQFVHVATTPAVLEAGT